MKHILLLILMLSFSVVGLAQDQNEDAQKSLYQAEQAFKSAEKAYEDARALKIQRENELNQARVRLRQATIQANQAKAAANPVQINPYKPIINPIYEKMSKGSQYGLSTFFEDSEVSGFIDVFSKDVDKRFKDYLKQYPNAKVRKKKGELQFDNILIPEISPTNIDIYADFIKQDNGVNIRTYFDLGSNFLNTNEDNPSVQYAKLLMDNFARFIRKENLENSISDLEKKLSSLQKSIESNKKEITSNQESIQNSESTISNSYNSISSLETELDDVNKQLEINRKKLSMVNYTGK